MFCGMFENNLWTQRTHHEIPPFSPAPSIVCSPLQFSNINTEQALNVGCKSPR